MNGGVSSTEQGSAGADGDRHVGEERNVIDVADTVVRSTGESRSSVLVFRDRHTLVRRSLGRAAGASIPQLGADNDRIDARVRPTIGKTAGVAGRRLRS